MAGFQSEHAGTYFIARAEVEPPKELLDMVFPKLNYWLRQPTEDITTKSFLKLLEYRIFGWSFYKTQYCYEHDILGTLYGTFQSSVIHHISRLLRTLPRALTAMISTGFEKQQQYTQRPESKLDFLEGRIAFQMTPVKLSHLVKMAVSMERGGSSTNSIGDSISIAPIPIDPRLDTSTSTQNAAVTTSFATPSERPESSYLANRYSLSP
ncbi:hypothetical protein E4U51_002789 [Claviceps purpurea]|nr:hypothetical protein E4U51_002789 [Claviceps purpurea]